MLSYFEIFNPEYYYSSESISLAVVQSCLLSFFICIWAVVLCFRSALKQPSSLIGWLAATGINYAAWNICFLSVYTHREIEFLSTTLTLEIAEKAYLICGIMMPYFANKVLARVFSTRSLVQRINFLSIGFAIFVGFISTLNNMKLLSLASGVFIFGSFTLISHRIWKITTTTEDARVKTRGVFVLVGLIICLVFDFIGQVRVDLFPRAPLPYLGNIFTALFVYFLYYLVMNPRLREVRELMLRGIGTLILTVMLSAIFLTLLAWVGENNPELFIFNTFIASFIILSVLDPVRHQVDRFFLKQFIVDQYELEKLTISLPEKFQASRSVRDLCSALIRGLLQSDRIYQTSIYLLETETHQYRLMPPSNLTFKQTIPEDHPLPKHLSKTRQPLLQDQGPYALHESLLEMHAHIVIPFFYKNSLMGLWAIRSSTASTNPYSSFSNTESLLLYRVAEEFSHRLEQLQYFDQMERQKRLAALGEMSAALAHEIRNPLGAIQGATQLLETSPTITNEEDKECLAILHKELERMQMTVDQYLASARTTEKYSRVDLCQIIEKVVIQSETKAKKTKTLIHFHRPLQTSLFLTDPLKIEQVLFNLVQNACEAFSKNIWIFLRQSNDGPTEIEVKDDGPGMDNEVMTNIFTPLFTTKKAGSGLGLPICKKMVESLQGHIRVESEPKQGTRFTLHLPPLESSTISSTSTQIH